MFLTAQATALARVSRDGSLTRIAPTAPAVHTAFQLWLALTHQCPARTSCGAVPSMVRNTGPVSRRATFPRINPRVSGGSLPSNNQAASAIW